MTTVKIDNLNCDDVQVGQELPSVDFPLTVYRLVMWAGAGRDFNSIHHNTEWAQQTGAPEMYANTLMLMGMWERFVREWAGPGAVITGLRQFRMRRFNTVGQIVTVRGSVSEVIGRDVTIDLATWDAEGVTVGPGQIDLRLAMVSE